MSCDFNRETLEAYALGLLDGDKKQCAASHIGSCGSCRTFVVQKRNTLHLLDDSFNDDAPEWLVSKTVAELQHRAANKGLKRFILPLSVTTGIVTCIVALFMLPGLETGRRYFMGKTKILSVSSRTPATARARARQARSEPSGGIVYSTVAKEEISQNESTSMTASHAAALTALHFDNPVADRSIYDNLGIPIEIAALLL